MGLLDDLASAASRARAGWRAFRDRGREDRELEEELRAYLEASAAARVRAGAKVEDARRQAWLEIGSLDAAKEEVREVGWESAVEAIVRDVTPGEGMGLEFTRLNTRDRVLMEILLRRLFRHDPS